jgi:hypothetical protein
MSVSIRRQGLLHIHAMRHDHAAAIHFSPTGESCAARRRNSLIVAQ